MELDLKIFRMNRLEIPQERIAKRLGQARETIRNHLAKMPELANQPKADWQQHAHSQQINCQGKGSHKNGKKKDLIESDEQNGYAFQAFFGELSDRLNLRQIQAQILPSYF